MNPADIKPALEAKLEGFLDKTPACACIREKLGEARGPLQAQIAEYGELEFRRVSNTPAPEDAERSGALRLEIEQALLPMVESPAATRIMTALDNSIAASLRPITHGSHGAHRDRY